MSSPTKKRGPHNKQAWEEKGINPASLAGRARAARVAAHLTSRELGPLVPVSYVTINHIENAETDPAVTTVQAVLSALRNVLGEKGYSEFFPLDLDLVELKSRGKITEQVINYPPPPPPLPLTSEAKPKATRARKQPTQPRTLKPETFENIASLGTKGKITPEGAEKLARRIKKREAEIVKEIERRERSAARKSGGKKR
jgi:DNA-binding XRE family transcriptional regulator